MVEIKKLLSELNGVRSIAQLDSKNKVKVIELESNYEKSGVIGLKNPGIRMVLQSNTVFAILKDSGFRPPPGSTVFMVEDFNSNYTETDNLLIVDNKKYNIIGEELINKMPPVNEEYMFIGDDFILYPKRREGKSNNPAYFLIPPLGFEELEEVTDAYKIKDIMSVSPSTTADDYIRKTCSFSLDNNLATILIGFNKSI